MKALHISFAILTGCTSPSFGQNILFSTRHDHLGLHFHDAATSVFPTYNEELMVVGMCDEPSYNDGSVSISYYDSLGQFQGVHSYGGPGIQFLPNYDGASSTPDGGFVAAVIKMDSTGSDHQAMLWRFDPEGDTSWTRMVYTDTAISSGATKAVRTRDGRFALTGNRYGPEPSVFLALFSPIGELQWTKEYPGPGAWNRHAKSLDTLADGGFIIGAYRALYGSEPDIDSWLIRTDSVGNIVWQQYHNTSHGEGGPRAMAWRSDRIVVAEREWGQTVINNAPYEYVLPKVSMLDTSGLLLWERTFPALWRCAWDWPTSIKHFSDTSFIMSSRAWHQVTDDHSGCMLNMSETGDSLWYREYWTGDTSCLLSSLYPTSVLVEPTGNIVLAGQWGYCGEDHWLMRVDAAGMPPPTMQLWTGIVNRDSSQPELSLSPNPTAGLITLRTEAQLDHIEVIDLSGRRILYSPLGQGTSDITVDLGGLTSGAYVVIAFDRAGHAWRRVLIKE